LQISHPLTGSMVALITPMYENGDIDFDALEKLVNFHIESGTKAIVSVGTTGESATLNHDEHIEVMKKTIEYSNGRIPVVAGTGANSTSEAIELTEAAKDINADACLLVTPYYNKPTQEGLYQHYKKIAESVEIDQILYNVPGRTGVDMSVDTVARLANIENIIGVKDATGDLNVAKSLIQKCPESFILLSGDDGTAIDFILMGGHGGISVTANVVPKLLSTAYDLAIRGNLEKAKEIDLEISNLHSHLFIESNPIPVKWAMHKMGFCENGIRLPLTKLESESRKIIEVDLQNQGLL
jgi:4-hydroxy-tetrahydrodipicolinate synthase